MYNMYIWSGMFRSQFYRNRKRAYRSNSLSILYICHTNGFIIQWNFSSTQNESTSKKWKLLRWWQAAIWEHTQSCWQQQHTYALLRKILILNGRFLLHTIHMLVADVYWKVAGRHKQIFRFNHSLASSSVSTLPFVSFGFFLMHIWRHSFFH